MEESEQKIKKTVCLYYPTWKRLHSFKLATNSSGLSEAVDLLFERYSKSIGIIKKLKSSPENKE